MGAMLLVGSARRRGSGSTRRNRSSTFWTRQVGARGAGHGRRRPSRTASRSWRRRACRAAPSASIRNCGACGRARRRRRGRCWGAPSAATCSCRIELALIASFYYATNRWLGWWQPSESLTDPNILGTAVPALAPIALSLQAGFMEECVFRAVPLSLAALIGARFGHRATGDRRSRSSSQALIFGGAHANYPGFPAYSRLVELLVPAMLWALIFLRFGLLPTIILHALFDLALFSIPLFLVDAPGGTCSARWSSPRDSSRWRSSLARRAQPGHGASSPDDLRNAAWQPPTAAADGAPARGRRRARPRRADGSRRSSARCRCSASPGLGAWVLCTPFHADAPPLRTGARASRSAGRCRTEGARRRARTRMDAQLGAATRKQRSGPRGDSHICLARGRCRGLPRALSAVFWRRRCGRSATHVRRRRGRSRGGVARHRQPRRDAAVRASRAAGGARRARSSTADAALAMAERALREQLGDDRAGARADRRRRTATPGPHRLDLHVRRPRVDVGKGGEARCRSTSPATRSCRSGRLVHVPEAWQRAEREREGRLTMVKLALGRHSRSPRWRRSWPR